MKQIKIKTVILSIFHFPFSRGKGKENAPGAKVKFAGLENFGVWGSPLGKRKFQGFGTFIKLNIRNDIQ